MSTNAPSSIEDAERRDNSNKIQNTTAGDSSIQVVQALGSEWSNPSEGRIFQEFAEWHGQYVAASDPATRAALEVEGARLAQLRRDQLTDLIESKPKTALQWSLPMSVRRSLPASLLPLIEERVSGRGDLAVFAAVAEPGKEAEVTPVFRVATLGGHEFQAYVYGHRAGEPSRYNIAMHGVALAGRIAVADEPGRLLERIELMEVMAAARPADPVCGISGESVPQASAGVEIAGENLLVCQPEHVDALNALELAAEGATDPSGSGPRFSALSTWTEGVKKLLLIRVDFSDIPGEPFSNSTGTNLVNGLDSFYRDMSFNKTGFSPLGQGSALTTTFRMPRTASYYGTNSASRLRTDARNAASAAGFVLGNYQLDVICFGSVPGWSWGGLGNVGGAGAWLRNSFSVGIAAHELGHNFGLNHANFWDTLGQSIIGDGSSIEYGDKFDTMGSASAGTKHFNARYKNYLDWIPSADVRTFSTNGIYRIYPHDDPNARGIRGLRILKNSSTNYWVEFRQKYVSNKWLMSGAGLRWAGNGNQKSQLLDVTPGSLNGKDDSAILIGSTFSDFQSGIHITAVRKGGTVPESLEVAVYKGSFAQNQAPTLELTSSATNANLNTLISFAAQASDPDGDQLAYSWDFDNGNFGGNSPNATQAFTAAGFYRVRCVVSDMRGGSTSRSILVRIASPATFTIRGQVTVDGKPLPNALVSVSSSKAAPTDSDGTFILTGLTTGNYSLNALAQGHAFIHPGFTNPVRVGPSKAGIDFLAIPPSGQSLVTLIPAGAVWKYLDNGSNQRTNWVASNFDDDAWKVGAAQLGYGDNDLTTVIGYGTNASRKFITTYFRHQFPIEDANNYNGLTLALLRDDGAVVYLNGREVFRSNMPGGTISYSTLASAAVSGSDESVYYETELSSSFLRTGTNLLAVEIHQSAADSSDLSFDLRLTAVTLRETARPALAWKVVDNQLLLTWPGTSLGYKVYSKPTFGSDLDWSPVEGTIIISNGLNVLALPFSSAEGFYQLQK